MKTKFYIKDEFESIAQSDELISLNINDKVVFKSAPYIVVEKYYLIDSKLMVYKIKAI